MIQKCKVASDSQPKQGGVDIFRGGSPSSELGAHSCTSVVGWQGWRGMTPHCALMSAMERALVLLAKRGRVHEETEGGVERGEPHRPENGDIVALQSMVTRKSVVGVEQERGDGCGITFETIL